MYYFCGYVIIFLMMLNHIIQEQTLIVLQREYLKQVYVCSGYARLYKDIVLYLNLEVECVSSYAKGASYKIGENMKKSNHEYNVIKLDNKWYPMDSTWGAGSVDGENFNKCFNEIYFLPNPELLITSHFPVDENCN